MFIKWVHSVSSLSVEKVSLFVYVLSTKHSVAVLIKYPMSHCNAFLYQLVNEKLKINFKTKQYLL